LEKEFVKHDKIILAIRNEAIGRQQLARKFLKSVCALPLKLGFQNWHTSCSLRGMPLARSNTSRMSLGQKLVFGLNALFALISILLVTGIAVRLLVFLQGQ
jgi:hypothetical protein